MLKRIYIDNFKCLYNFELPLGNINLLLGSNGSGKSSVFEVLRKLQTFIGGVGRTNSIFLFSDRSRWMNMPVQSFELDFAHPEGIMRYELKIEHSPTGDKNRVSGERLFFENQPLYLFERGEIQLFRDDFSRGPSYEFDSTQTGLATITPRNDNTRLMWFKDQIKRLVVVQIIPQIIQEYSEHEDPYLDRYLENFTSWYRYLSLDQGLALQVQSSLQNVMPNFNSFRYEIYGENTRRLSVEFSDKNHRSPVLFKFSELSDGQRVIIVLYTLLHAAQDEKNKYILCLDEPENFLALPEIQPWLVRLYDFCSEGRSQALLISHHPEMINYLLASPIGYWFEKDQYTTRIKPIVSDSQSGLPISELIARGWING